MPKKFGQALRELRKERGISQDELAHRADLERAYIGRLERGESSPTLTTIQALARALGIKPSRLISRME